MHVLLVFTALPLFLGAWLAAWAYGNTYELQWTNFAAWLIAGGLVPAGLALAWALFDTVRGRSRRRRGSWYLGLLFAACAIGLVNALVHAKDGWAAMPAGLWLSLLAWVTLAAAAALGWTGLRSEVAR